MSLLANVCQRLHTHCTGSVCFPWQSICAITQALHLGLCSLNGKETCYMLIYCYEDIHPKVCAVCACLELCAQILDRCSYKPMSHSAIILSHYSNKKPLARSGQKASIGIDTVF